MTDRQSITAIGSEGPVIPQEYFYPRVAVRRYANRRQQAIDEAVRLALTKHGEYIRGWVNKPGQWPIIAYWVRDEYRKIMSGEC